MKKTKAFCAGGDVRKVYDAGIESFKKSGTVDRGGVTDAFFREEYWLNYKIHQLGQQYKGGKGYGQVTFWDGVTMGGGVGLSIHAPFRVCTSQTAFAMPETAIGLFPDVGGSHWLPRLPHAGMGQYLGLTGRRLNGRECVAVGVGTHFVAEPVATDKGFTAVDLTTNFLVGGHSQGGSIEEILAEIEAAAKMAGQSEQGPTAIEQQFEDIERAFANKACVEDIVSELLRMNNDFATSTLKDMGKYSPLSMKVTHEMIKRGGRLDMAGCLEMEFWLTQHFMSQAPTGDFYEGIRALLVDKDNKPKWNHARLEDVRDEEVMSYFTPIEGVKKWTPEGL